MLILSATIAVAASTEIGLSVGLLPTAPTTAFAHRWFTGAALAVGPSEVFMVRFDARAWLFQARCDPWSDCDFRDRVAVPSEHVSRPLFATDATFQFAPSFGGPHHQGRIELLGGFGLVKTVDDVIALRCLTDPACIGTEKQWLPTLMAAAGGWIDLNAHTRIHLDLQISRYVEVVKGTTLDVRTPLELLIQPTWTSRHGAPPPLNELPVDNDDPP